jgi:cob(I)alamin adenosyltransferase
MLYTGKGDNGNTSLYGSKEKLSKSSSITEALGSLDEINSYLGICKAKVMNAEISEMINSVQNNLFITQAQVAGADKKIKDGEVKAIENIVGDIEKKLPPITSFLISGATEISAHFDFARTLVRRAERRVVAVSETNSGRIDPYTLAYLNRLSSLMYAYARFLATESSVSEKAPTY